MVIGEVTLDPRKVLYTYIERMGRDWKLSITYLIGDAATTIDQYGTRQEMVALASKIDSAAYKGEIVDARATVTVDDDESGDAEDEPDETGDGKREVWNKVGFRPK